MSADAQQRHRRWLIAGLLLAGTAILLVWSAYQRHARAQQLALEIRTNRGEVYFPPPLPTNIQQWWNGQGWSSFTTVWLREACLDSKWLQERNYLAELPVTHLVLDGKHISTDDVLLLISTHPLSSFETTGHGDADLIAAALSKKPRLENVGFENSDLTDEGLRSLPLEQLCVIDVSGTRVTPDGLSELRRCKSLIWVGLDGRQLDETSAQTLQELPKLHSLALKGMSVNDERVECVRSLQKLPRLHLAKTSVTKPMLDEVTSSLPATQILHYPPIQ